MAADRPGSVQAGPPVLWKSEPPACRCLGGHTGPHCVSGAPTCTVRNPTSPYPLRRLARTCSRRLRLRAETAGSRSCAGSEAGRDDVWRVICSEAVPWFSSTDLGAADMQAGCTHRILQISFMHLERQVSREARIPGLEEALWIREQMRLLHIVSETRLATAGFGKAERQQAEQRQKLLQTIGLALRPTAAQVLRLAPHGSLAAPAGVPSAL